MTIPNSIKNADRETLEKLAWGWYQMVCDLERQVNCKQVSRVEVIDETGRGYVKYLNEDQHAWLSFQDDNQTLKVFIERDVCCEGGPMTAGCLHDNCKGPIDHGHAQEQGDDI